MKGETTNDAMKPVTDDASRADPEALSVRNGQGRGGVHHDIQRLGTRIRHLHHTLLDLASAKDFEALIGLIQRPEYTTAAEFRLVAGLVESMHEQANTLAGLKQLVTAASYTIVGD